MRTPLALLSVCAVAVLSLAATADASTIAVSRSGVLNLDARAGEVNGVTLTEVTIPRGSAYSVQDTAGLRVGRGCTRVSATQAQCTIGQASDPLLGGLTISRIELDLGNLADTSSVFTFDGFASVEVRGGAGDDVLTGGPSVPAGGVYAVRGGLGDDTISGIATNGGAVDIEGGPGDDSVSTRGLIGTGSLRGGPGADTFTIGPGSVFATIDGGQGRDVITATEPGGFIGPTVLGGSDADTINAPAAASIDCGPGLDSFVVYAGQGATRCEIPLS